MTRMPTCPMCGRACPCSAPAGLVSCCRTAGSQPDKAFSETPPRPAVKMGLPRAYGYPAEDGVAAPSEANLLAAASEVVDADFSSDEVSDFIHDFALLVDDIDPEDVLRSINEDRAVSGFPEVRDIDLIEAELAERKRYYRNAIKAALNRLNSPELVSTMTMLVDNATLGGEVHAPELIDELVDAYAVETQGVLAKESQNADRLIRTALESAKSGEAAVRSEERR